MAEHYFDLDIQDKPTNCPIGKKSCGIIDTLNNYLCIENNIDCPVTNIQITKIDSNDTPLNNKINMGDYNLIYSKAESNLNIPIELKISNSTPCKNPYFYHIPNPIYLLDFYKNRQYCYEFIENMKYFEIESIDQQIGYPSNQNIDQKLLAYDDTFTKIDTYKTKSLLKENNIYDLLIRLPKINLQYYDGDTSLYQKSYFGLKTSCLKEIRSKKLKEQLYLDFQRIEDSLDSLGLLSTSLILLIISNVFYLSNLFFDLIAKCGEEETFEIRPYLSLFGYIPLAIAYLIISVILGFKSSNQSIVMDQIFRNTDCVDNYTLQMYDKFVLKNQSLDKFTLIPAIFSIIILLSEIFIAIVIRCAYKKLY